MTKDFEQWHKLKAQLDVRRDSPTFQQQQIWWCHLGANVGHEENGKGDEYSRPILVVRKFNPHIFLGIPLTTKIKDSPHYFKIIIKDRIQCAMLSQIRVWDSKRMINIMGKLSDNQFNRLKDAIRGII